MKVQEDNGNEFEMNQDNRFEWFNLNNIRSCFSCKFETPFDKRVNEERTLTRKASQAIKYFPLPISGFHNGIRILNEDGTVLLF